MQRREPESRSVEGREAQGQGRGHHTFRGEESPEVGAVEKQTLVIARNPLTDESECTEVHVCTAVELEGARSQGRTLEAARGKSFCLRRKGD